jgi:hypothetical protein
MGTIVVLSICASTALAELPPPNPATEFAVNLTTASDAVLVSHGIQRKILGPLNLPSGKLIAIDPISLVEQGSHFVQMFPVGASIAYAYLTNDDFNGERVVLTEVQFSDEKVEQWRLAEVEDVPRPATLVDTDYGMIVEGAIGSYMSPEFLTEIKNPKLYPSEGSFYSEYLFDKLNGSQQAVSFLFQYSKHSKVNAAVFETGDSDGIYPSFIGYSKSGKPIKLVTTFFMLEQKGR